MNPPINSNNRLVKNHFALKRVWVRFPLIGKLFAKKLLKETILNINKFGLIWVNIGIETVNSEGRHQLSATTLPAMGIMKTRQIPKYDVSDRAVPNSEVVIWWVPVVLLSCWGALRVLGTGASTPLNRNPQGCRMRPRCNSIDVIFCWKIHLRFFRVRFIFVKFFCRYLIGNGTLQ